MNDFVSAGATHEYVRQLEARVAALEAVVAALSAPPPALPRREYMREYMARKRAAQRASDVSTHEPDTPSPNA